MMDIDDDPEINLTIPVKQLVEEISCPICFSNIKEATMTLCGHNFCSKCILECINRNHKCPCCNFKTTKENLVRNHHLDKLISIIDKEKEDASKSYFNNLIASSGIQNNNKSNINNQPSSTSPIHELFSKYIRSSLLSYEDFYQQLELKYKENVVRLEQDKLLISQKYKDNDLLLQQAMEEYKYSLEKLDKSNKNTTDLLLKSFEEHLKSVAVPPSFVNIQISIIVVEKDITFDHISLRPSSTVTDIKSIVVEKLNQKGGDHAFIKYGDDVKVVVQKPLVVGGGDIDLTDENKPISLYQVPQGSKIVILGRVLTNGDLPKECFSTTYKPGDTMDYFRCVDCGYNWICKPCADYCHKGHNKVVYLSNHKASFGCCYDQRHKKCKIVK